MSSLIEKEINGNRYYYLVESKRINGKPTHVNQVYIGPVKEVHQRLLESIAPPTPLYTKCLDFGDVVSIFDLASRLQIVSLINSIAGKRNQGVSVGTYLLLAAINRAVAPSPKTHMAEWYEKTILTKLLPTDPKLLSCQRFWDNVNRWDDEKIHKFEVEFVRQIVDSYQIPVTCLVYDATNFFTYVDTANTKASLARRGHSKEKRKDLKIIGLSLLVSAEEEIPLFYEVYAGNTPDSVQFRTVAEKLKTRYQEVFGKEAEITLVFDRGNNSEDNIDLLEKDALSFHYIGGLQQNQCLELYDIPKKKYIPLHGEEFGKTKAFRDKRIIFGREMTVLITDNPELTRGQLQGIHLNTEKCRQKLIALQEKLGRWVHGEIKKRGKSPTLDSAQKQVKQILAPKYMEEVFQVIWDDSGKHPYFQFSFMEEQLSAIEEKYLGKTVLFTDQHEWDNEAIVHAYRSAWRIEAAFRQMKDTEYISVRPMWHWTDQMIKVHIFCCVLAYRLCCLLRKELRKQGLDLSIARILGALEEKKQCIHYYQKKRGLGENYSLTQNVDDTERLFKILGLEKYKLS